MRTLKDGSLLFSRGEEIPKFIPNFEQDPSDPCHWIPSIEDCKYRCKRRIQMPCGKFKEVFECGYFKQNVALENCLNCEVNDDGRLPDQ